MATDVQAAVAFIGKMFPNVATQPMRFPGYFTQSTIPSSLVAGDVIFVQG